MYQSGKKKKTDKKKKSGKMKSNKSALKIPTKKY